MLAMTECLPNQCRPRHRHRWQARLPQVLCRTQNPVGVWLASDEASVGAEAQPANSTVRTRAQSSTSRVGVPQALRL